MAGTALVQALNEVDGDLSDDHAALHDALSIMTLEVPFGTVTLDENRQGIIDTYVAQLVLDEATGDVVQKTVSIIQRCRPDLRRHVRARRPRRRDVTPRAARLATCRGRATRSPSSTACRRADRQKQAAGP